MARTDRIGLMTLALASALSVGGCTTIVTQTVGKALEDRTTEDQVTDTKIGSGIISRLTNKDANLVLDVTADVWEQRVMLTGTLDNPQIRGEVVQLVRKDQRVREVYDEIQIVSTEEMKERREEAEQKDEAQKESEGGANDYWISGKIKAQLLSAKGVTSVNYRWHTVKQIVYIIGRARSEAELNKVLRICRETVGVKEVKHFIEIKPVS